MTSGPAVRVFSNFVYVNPAFVPLTKSEVGGDIQKARFQSLRGLRALVPKPHEPGDCSDAPAGERKEGSSLRGVCRGGCRHAQAAGRHRQQRVAARRRRRHRGRGRARCGTRRGRRRSGGHSRGSRSAGFRTARARRRRAHARRALAAALSPQKRVSVAGERWPCARRGVFPAECDCLLSGRTLPGWTEAGDGGTELGVLFVPAGGQNTRAAAAHGPAVRGWRWAAAGAARYDFFLCVWRRAGSGKQAVSTVGHLEACLAQAGSRGGWAFSGVALRARRQNAPQPERVGVQF